MSRFQPGQSGNPDGRKKGTRNKTSAALDGLIPEESRKVIVEKLLEKAKAGDVTAATAILDRCWPRLRPEARAIPIDLGDAATLAQKAEAVVDSIAAGALPADIGGDILRALAAIAELHKLNELERRLAALEGDENEKP